MGNKVPNQDNYISNANHYWHLESFWLLYITRVIRELFSPHLKTSKIQQEMLLWDGQEWVPPTSGMRPSK
jgi:hypothetical protein